MSLTKQDLADIRDVIFEALEAVVNPRLDSLEQRMDSLEQRMDSLEGRMAAQEHAQHETNLRLGNLERAVNEVQGRLEALENDVKELYLMVDKRTKINLQTQRFSALSGEKKILALYEAVTDLAQEMGVRLPIKSKLDHGQQKSPSEKGLSATA